MVEIIFPSQITDLFNPSTLFQIMLHLWLPHSARLFWHLQNEPPFKKEKKELAGDECLGDQQPALPVACARPRNLLRSCQLLTSSGEMWG